MSTATAQAAASISIQPFHPDFSRSVAIVDRYVRMFSPRPAKTPSLLTNDSAITMPQPIAAEWLENVCQRIANSVLMPGERSQNDDEAAISQEIGDSATWFFTNTSDVLPTEPHLYSSRSGDLVAEFEGKYGRLTAIISDSSVLAFAVFGEKVSDMQLELCPTNVAILRSGLKVISNRILRG
jgi:hypothetical protein